MTAPNKPRREHVRIAGPSETTTVHQIIRSHQFYPNFGSPWQIAKIDIISNPKLETQFKVHVNILCERGCGAPESAEDFGFMLEPRLANIQNDAMFGVQTQQSNYNAMGYSYEGVYLSRYADVCLHNAVSNLATNNKVIRILICKYATGRQTKAIPRNSPCLEYIHPTPGFDCHVPLLPPSLTDSPQTVFDNSQVYLYDMDPYKQPVNYPRQLLPYAVVHFTNGGQYIPEIDMDVEEEDAALAPVQAPMQSLSLDTAALSEADVHRIIKTSLLNPQYEFTWKPAHFCVMLSNTLKHEFEGKRQELIKRGCNSEETRERWGFYVQNNPARGVMICNYGLHTKEDGYNAMGYNSMGVYLSKHIDATLQHCLLKPYSAQQVIRVILCKYMTGKATKAIPREPGAFEFIKPTLAFDSHECLFQPTVEDPVQQKMDRSMIYLYELNTVELPVARPRHVLPYAIVSFTQHGVRLPNLDRIPSLESAQLECKMSMPKSLLPPPPPPGCHDISPALGIGSLGAVGTRRDQVNNAKLQQDTLNRLADNPQLQQLIMQINAKKPSPYAVSAQPPPFLRAPPPSSQHSQTPPTWY